MKNSYSILLFGAFLGVFLLTLGCSKKSIDSTDATTVSSFDLIQQKILTPHVLPLVVMPLLAIILMLSMA
jgi:hypothetical protein